MYSAVENAVFVGGSNAKQLAHTSASLGVDTYKKRPAWTTQVSWVWLRTET
jgi:hypothetical protein